MSVRVCLYGTGQASAHHVEVLRAVAPEVAISVASRDRAKADAFRAAHALAGAFGSYDDAMAAPTDVAVIATPPSTHADLVGRLLPTGAHLLVEKPAFGDLGELQRLWPDLVAARDRVMIGENQHFAPQAATLRDTLRRESFGRPILIQVNRMIHSPLRTWRADPVEMPWGALHEAGVHWIRRLLHLTETFADDADTDVLHVDALSPATRTTETPGDETMVVLAQHASGALSQLTHSWGIAHRTGFFDLSKVVCENGAIYFDARGRIGIVFAGRRGRPSGVLAPVRKDRNGYEAMWRSFLGSARQGTLPELTLEESFRDFAYLDAAYRSQRSGRREVPVRVGD